jgi:hypothetical protein
MLVQWFDVPEEEKSTEEEAEEAPTETKSSEEKPAKA